MSSRTSLSLVKINLRKKVARQDVQKAEPSAGQPMAEQDGHTLFCPLTGENEAEQAARRYERTVRRRKVNEAAGFERVEVCLAPDLRQAVADFSLQHCKGKRSRAIDALLRQALGLVPECEVRNAA